MSKDINWAKYISPVQVKELPYTAYASLVDIFGADMLKKFRKEFKDNCLGAAEIIKDIMNNNGVLAEIITFKNGNAFMDGGIVIDTDHRYLYHTIVLMGEWIIDVLHTDKSIKTKDYIESLQKNNPKLRIDYTLSTCWYSDSGLPIRPSIEDLKNYKY